MGDFVFNGRRVGKGEPCFIVAEMSANHAQSLDRAKKILDEARRAGADAVKIQTYTADTMTLASDRPEFQLVGTRWEGKTLHDLYKEAHMPWEWHPELALHARDLGLEFFSTPFDSKAVAFLEGIGTSIYKVASFELTDLPLLQTIGSTRKPVIVSTGMGTVGEIEEALATLYRAGCPAVALLRCTMAFPAAPEEMNLRSIPDMIERFGVPIGLSDHSLELGVPVVAVAMGACIIEKHFTLSRADGGADASFSLEPSEFKSMVDAVRVAEKSLGSVQYGAVEREKRNTAFRRSIFVAQPVAEGEVFTTLNLRIIRPADGLPPKHFSELMGRKAAQALEAGTPLRWEMVASGPVPE